MLAPPPPRPGAPSRDRRCRGLGLQRLKPGCCRCGRRRVGSGGRCGRRSQGAPAVALPTSATAPPADPSRRKRRARITLREQRYRSPVQRVVRRFLMHGVPRPHSGRIIAFVGRGVAARRIRRPQRDALGAIACGGRCSRRRGRPPRRDLRGAVAGRPSRTLSLCPRRRWRRPRCNGGSGRIGGHGRGVHNGDGAPRRCGRRCRGSAAAAGGHRSRRNIRKRRRGRSGNPRACGRHPGVGARSGLRGGTAVPTP